MLGSIEHEHIAALIDALATSDAEALLGLVDELARQSRNLEGVLDELARCMHRIALIHAAPDFRDPDRTDWESLVGQAGRVSAEDAQLYYQIAVHGRRDLGIAPDPRTGLEMTLLRMLAFRPADSGHGANAAGGSNRGKAGQRAAAAADASSATGRKGSGGAGRSREQAAAAKVARESFDVMRGASGETAGGEQKADLFASADANGPARRGASGASAAETEAGAGKTAPVDWHSLQASLKLSGGARELARNLQLESSDGDRWVFLVPDALRHLGSDSTVKMLQAALSEWAGHAVMLDLHVSSEPLHSVSASEERVRIRRMTEAEQAIEDDATVTELREKFGATIVPDSIQPLQ
jgi:DNA polymerase-3 subunit gamma/tau